MTFDLAPAWFKWALHEIGTREETGNRGAAIRRYIALAHAGVEGDPWCAIFANAALEANGIHGTRSASSQSFRNDPNFVSLAGPSLGAIVVFWRNSPQSGVGHVGFYRGESSGYVYTLGGNEGDMVQIEPLPKSGRTLGLRGYYWPKSVPLPAIAAIAMPQGAPAQKVSVT
ncbi:MAG TPA: TIGR02594 family protein [Pseudolabrys sp.]|nr:TIGR02594 family protein [Pseudolabrys sp.]